LCQSHSDDTALTARQRQGATNQCVDPSSDVGAVHAIAVPILVHVVGPAAVSVVESNPLIPIQVSGLRLRFAEDVGDGGGCGVERLLLEAIEEVWKSDSEDESQDGQRNEKFQQRVAGIIIEH